MLHHIRADDHVAHAQFRRERAGDARVDDEFRLVDERHGLRADGGVDLAHAGAGDDHVRSQELSAGKGHAADLPVYGFLHGVDQPFQFDIQRADDADHLTHFLS